MPSPRRPKTHLEGPLPEGIAEEQLLRRIVKWFRGGLVFKALRLLYHSISGSRIKKKKRVSVRGWARHERRRDRDREDVVLGERARDTGVWWAGVLRSRPNLETST